jgi:hypothetical protein
MNPNNGATISFPIALPDVTTVRDPPNLDDYSFRRLGFQVCCYTKIKYLYLLVPGNPINGAMELT